jgi:hypothetical protein
MVVAVRLSLAASRAVAATREMRKRRRVVGSFMMVW